MGSLVDPVFLALKAAIASTLAVVLMRWLGGIDLLSAGFVALVCISPSAHAGLRSGLQQVAGSLLGAAAGGLPILVAPAAFGAPWALAPGVAAALYANFRLGLGGAYLVAGFTVVYFHTMPFGSPRVVLVARVIAVLVGIVSATLVNGVVSSLAGPGIAARRLGLVRAAVASSLRAVVAREERAFALTDRAFSAVAELRLDLSASARERLFPGAAAARFTASRGLAIAAALEQAAHLTREVDLLLPAGSTPPALAHQLERVAIALETGSADRVPAALDESAQTSPGAIVLASVVRRLTEAAARSVG